MWNVPAPLAMCGHWLGWPLIATLFAAHSGEPLITTLLAAKQFWDVLMVLWYNWEKSMWIGPKLSWGLGKCSGVITEMVITDDYCIAGNFRGVLIFVIFVTIPRVTKFSTH